MSTLAMRKTTRTLSTFTLAIAAALSAAAAMAAQPYRITDLGEYLVPRAINEKGQVTGTTDNPWNPSEGFLYSPGSGLLKLPGLWTVDINDHGELTGSYRPQPNLSRGFRYSVARGLEDLGSITDAPDSRVFGTAINNSGRVAGWFDQVGTEAQAFVSSRGSPWVPLGTLPGDNSSVPIDINDAGVVIGQSRRIGTYPNRYVPFIWSADAGMKQFEGSYLAAINNAGQVAGYFHEDEPPDIDEGIPRGEVFLYTPGSGALRLGRAGALGSTPSGINDAGDVVGTLHHTFTAGISPFLYTAADGMVGLSSLLYAADRAKWDLQWAADINNNGQIIGVGNIGDVQHGFLLTPVPEPGTWALMLAGLAALGVVRWHRRASPAAAVPA